MKTKMFTRSTGKVVPPRKMMVNNTMKSVVVNKTLFVSSFSIAICKANANATAPLIPENLNLEAMKKSSKTVWNL